MYTHSPEHQLAARWPEQACKAASSGPLLQRAAGRPVKRGFVCLGSRKGERQCSHLAVCQHGASETVGKWLWAHRLWRCRALPGRPHTTSSRRSRRQRWGSVSQHWAKPCQGPARLHSIQLASDTDTSSSKVPVNSRGVPEATGTASLAKPSEISLPPREFVTYLEAFGSSQNIPVRLLVAEKCLTDKLCVHGLDQVVLYNRYLQKISLRAIIPHKFSLPHLISKQYMEDSLLAVYQRHFSRVLWTNTKQ